MLDCSRQFFTVDEIKRLLDQMAIAKMNVFHWHLTDDNGWRIEIKGYPNLTKRGATWVNSSFPDNGKTLFYSQDDIREIVRYASDLHITIVPEIELPGHALAAILSYPELFCVGAEIPKLDVSDFWIIYNAVGFTPPICMTRPEVVKWMHSVLDQVMDLFPGKFIHIGGDEVPQHAKKWSQCSSCSKLMKLKGLSDNDMQKYLAEELRDYVGKRGKQVIGWSEMYNGGAVPGTALMDWIGGSPKALEANCPVVASPTFCSYLDYQETPGDPITTPRSSCSLQTVYQYDPRKGVSPDKQNLILGSQGNLWTHIARNEREIQFCLFPRALAVAERGWTELEHRSYEDFRQRLQGQFTRMQLQNIRFNVPEPECRLETKNGQDPVLTIHNPAGDVGQVFFSWDRSPTEKSAMRYKGPVAVPRGIRCVQAITILDDQWTSQVVKQEIPAKQ